MSAFHGTAPLGPREIRVLDLPTSTPGIEVQVGARCLSGTLRIVNLDDNPKYSALSYVWGTFSIPCDTLKCSKSSLEIDITTNCSSALRNLTTKLGALTIWVDAICINQASEEEKLQQIPLMRDIYSRATNVYIYLGDSSPGTTAAMNYFRTYGYQKSLHADPSDKESFQCLLLRISRPH